MFCPGCGRDDSHERKFCPSCGTNLEAISQTLAENDESSFTKVGKSLDRFIARYSEHLFKDAPAKALDQRIGTSWQLLGQGALTSLFDLALFIIMTVLLPIRFLILLIHTPVKVLSERSRNRKSAPPEFQSKDVLYLPDPQSRGWLPPPPVASVTEHTTVNLSKQAINNKGAEAQRRKG
ncbi:MAG: hypothetical protein QOH25_1672 [Acidobacteriota bacterium]|jgi:hypothetical protein|nr:hypothetical protein [Acidobacteriota bacterium]